MSDITSIQWADTTVNPIMGCGGCELFPSPGQVLAAIDEAVAEAGSRINSRAIYKELINEAHSKIKKPKPCHKNAVNTTNIWHLRELFLARVKRDHGPQVEAAAHKAIRQSITCYAATLHLNKGLNLLKPNYEGKNGYAPIFESVETFNGRSEKAANLKDLLGSKNQQTPWKDGLPRMIFVSDMGDALSAQGDFPFLKSDLIPAITSENGKHHLWLWLTKRPANMAKFAEQIGGLPPNVCAMTTLTGPDDESLQRLSDLKQVKAHIKGLSIEPLWDRIPPSKLNLKGIDWLILGGESGSGALTRPFSLEWAEELRDYCRKHGVAFFLKQLGRNPARSGRIFTLKDKHGGEWEEWPDEALKIREFPKAFHDYRKDQMKPYDKPRPVAGGQKKKKQQELTDVTPEEKSEFKRLDKIVKRGIEAFAEAGDALLRIHEGRLWRAGEHATWEAYCRSVAGMSKVHASRLMRASQCFQELKTLPIGNVLPVAESQVRPLLKLPEQNQRVAAWKKAVEVAEGAQPTAIDVMEAVVEILPNDENTEKAETVRDRRQRLIGSLRDAIRNRVGWQKLESLVTELEELL